MSKSNILIGITGSIAAYKICELISRWTQAGHSVRVATTPNALNFIGKGTLEGLSGHPVFSDNYTPGQAMEHIQLSRWADVFLLAPLTANSISRLAMGMGETTIETLFLARRPELPVFLAPAMNIQMYENPLIQENLTKLKSLANIKLIEPESGALACGEVGAGRLANIDSIHEALFANNTEAKRLLITSGGTREPIDDIRYLSNISTGKTGAFIADSLVQTGFNVTYLHGSGAAQPKSQLRSQEFSSFSDLKMKLKSLLKNEHFDGVIHLAAVSDYSPEKISGKISSDQQITIKLKPNEKIISELKQFSKNKSIKIVGFKLTSSLDEQEKLTAIKKLFLKSSPDYVVHNDLLQIIDNKHPFRIFSADNLIASGESKLELSKEIGHILGAQI